MKQNDQEQRPRGCIRSTGCWLAFGLIIGGFLLWKRFARKSEPTFDEIYRDVSEEKKRTLLHFRGAYPYSRVTHDGTEWHYIACGQGERALLLLGGGLAAGETSFRRILELEDRYRLIAPTYPPVTGMAALVDGLMAILDQEGIDKVDIYGHSFGAAVAHVLVRRYPERVGKVALSAFGIYTEQNVGRMRFFVKVFDRLPYVALQVFYRWRIEKMLLDADEEEKAFMLAYLNDLFLLQFDKEEMMARFELLVELVENAEELKVFEPVERPGEILFITAQDDSGFEPTEREMLSSLYPGADVHVFDSGGHWVQFKRREEYNAVLHGFLERPTLS
jgi:pimeloyl-ACP methyl ester carboxylesterase